MAKRKCDCGSEFGSKKKAVGERMPKYKTNITQQKDKLETVVRKQYYLLYSMNETE